MAELPQYGGPKIQEQAIPGFRMPDAPGLEAFGGGASAERLTQATTGVAGEAGDLAKQEYDRANQLAVMASDRQLAERQTQIQVNASKLLGKDALSAPDYIQSEWEKSVKEIHAQATNRDQQMAILRSSQQRGLELHRYGQMHAAEQIKSFDENETKSYLDASRNSATVNAFDDSKVSFEVQRTTAALEDWAKRNGVYTDQDGKVSQIYQTRLQDTLSTLHKDVIAARLDKDDPQGVDAAKAYLAANKDGMAARDFLVARKQVENAETKQLGSEMWQGVQGFELEDGSPDEARMERAIMARQDLTEQRKLQVWSYVKARANEHYTQTMREQQSSDRDFMNELVSGRKQGMPLDQALKLAEQYGYDDYDQSVKELAVQKVYAPADKTNPDAFLGLWQKNQDGTGNQRDIKTAFQQGLINVGDYRSLSEGWYKSKLEAEQPEQKQTWERIKILAEEKLPDKINREKFLYELHTMGHDMQPEQLLKTAVDKLDKAPATTWFGQNVWNLNGPQYQADVSRMDAENMAWGKLYQDLGKDTAMAIGQGALYAGKPKWGLGDVDAFAQSFGGYDKIKQGTPVNNAMQSLVRRGQLVTASNIKAVLSRYPDGKY